MKKRARGAGRIFLRGKIWWIQYYNNRGLQVRESAETNDKKKAEKLLLRRLGEVAIGIHHDTRNLTYEELRDAFCADYDVNGRKSLRRNREGLPKRLDKVQRLDTFFYGFRALDVDVDQIRKFIKHEQARGLSNASINRSISSLRRMFNIARQDGKLRNVPPHFPMLKEAKPRKGFFEHDQYRSLSAALPDYLHLPLALGYYTGMRRGEVLQLEWDQVDFLAGTINLRAGETKNDEGRTIPIVPELKGLLVSQHAKRQPGCRFVCFRLDARGHAVKIGSFRKVWESRCVKLGLGKMEPVLDRKTGEPSTATPHSLLSKLKPKMRYKGMIYHDLRRSAVRNLVRSGVPQSIAKNITGHAMDSVFEKYNIVSETDVNEAGRKLAIFHGQKVGGQFGDNRRD